MFLAFNEAFLYPKVLRWRDYLEIPRSPRISKEAQDLILGLITSADRRLGGNDGGSQEIKEHPFFASIDWSLDIRQQQAAFVPSILNPTDTSNFDPIDDDDSDDSEEEEAPAAPGAGGIDDPNSGNYIRLFDFTFRRSPATLEIRRRQRPFHQTTDS